MKNAPFAVAEMPNILAEPKTVLPIFINALLSSVPPLISECFETSPVVLLFMISFVRILDRLHSEMPHWF